MGQPKDGAGVQEPMLNFMVDYDTGYPEYYECGIIHSTLDYWNPRIVLKSTWERHDELGRLAVDLHSSHQMIHLFLRK